MKNEETLRNSSFFILHFRNDPIELRLENVERAFVPNDVIRREHFLFDWPLRGEALFDLLDIVHAAGASTTVAEAALKALGNPDASAGVVRAVYN